MSKKGSRWTKEEDDFLEFAFKTGLSLNEMEEALEGRTKNAIKSRTIQKGLRRNFPKREKDGLVRCSHCKEYKPKEEYLVLSNGKFYCYCNECRTLLNKEKYLKKKKEKTMQQANKTFKTKVEANNGLKTKVCSKCGIEKDVEEFHWEQKGKKLSSMCKACKKKSNAEYQKKSLRTPGF